jgi:hypothetical protein
MLPIIISDAERKNSLDILWEREENLVKKNLKYNFLIVFGEILKAANPKKSAASFLEKNRATLLWNSAALFC